MSQKVIKLVIVLMSMTNKNIKEELERVPYIWYVVTFKKLIEALYNSISEVNAMS